MQKAFVSSCKSVGGAKGLLVKNHAGVPKASGVKVLQCSILVVQPGYWCNCFALHATLPSPTRYPPLHFNRSSFPFLARLVRKNC